MIQYVKLLILMTLFCASYEENTDSSIKIRELNVKYPSSSGSWCEFVGVVQGVKQRSVLRGEGLVVDLWQQSSDYRNGLSGGNCTVRWDECPR